jgi:hypothetical protein
MEVNLAPHKTCVVVFRRPRARVPGGFRLLYRGCEVARQPQYNYLGVAFHETRGLAVAADALAAAGSKAMHALLTWCRKANLTQLTSSHECLTFLLSLCCPMPPTYGAL